MIPRKKRKEGKKKERSAGIEFTNKSINVQRINKKITTAKKIDYTKSLLCFNINIVNILAGYTSYDQTEIMQVNKVKQIINESNLTRFFNFWNVEKHKCHDIQKF